MQEEVECLHCERSFKNRQQYKHHLTTKGHLRNVKEFPLQHAHQSFDLPAVADEDESETNIPNLQEDVEVNVDEQTCIFCFLVSTTLSENFNHMKVQHGHIPPGVEYLEDAEGYFFFLAKRIFEDCCCVQCGDVFDDPEILQKHISNKKHANLDIFNLDNMDYLSFYNFPDGDEMFLYR